MKLNELEKLVESYLTEEEGNKQKKYTVEPKVQGKSDGEKAESFICFGMRLGPPDPKKFSGAGGFIGLDQINPHPLLKGKKGDFFYSSIKIGQAIARDQGRADPTATQAGGEKVEVTPLAQKILKTSKSDSKTDIVAYGNNISVKMGSGAQLEAMETNTIRLVLEVGAQKVGAKEKIAQEAFRVVKESLSDQLDKYRTAQVARLPSGDVVVNALYKLHDKEISDEEALKFLKKYSEFEPEELLQIQEFIKNLFQTPLFRRELIYQAATGAAKFPKGSPAIPSHILIFDAPSESYYYDSIDNWLKGAVSTVKIEVRTGRSAPAPIDSKKPHYSPERPKTWDAQVQPKLAIFAEKFAKSVEDVKSALIKGGVEFLDDGSLNKYNYELLKHASEQVTKSKWSDKLSSIADFIKLIKKDFEEKKTVETDGKRFFKGRSGRFGTDTGKEGELTPIDAPKDTPSRMRFADKLPNLEEGALDWLKEKFKSAVSTGKKLINKLKDAFKNLSFFKTADSVGAEIEITPGEVTIPTPPMKSVNANEPQTQNESLTKSKITYKMLEQMVEEAIKKAR